MSLWNQKTFRDNSVRLCVTINFANLPTPRCSIINIFSEEQFKLGYTEKNILNKKKLYKM
jgi:hypothetical protein